MLALGAGAKSVDADAARFEDAARAGAVGAGAAGLGAAGAATAGGIAVLPASSEMPRAAARTSTTFRSAHDGSRMTPTACNARSKAAGAPSCSFAGSPSVLRKPGDASSAGKRKERHE